MRSTDKHTVDYHSTAGPSEAPTEQVKDALVAAPAAQATTELQALLLRRLCFLSLGVTVLYACASALYLWVSRSIPGRSAASASTPRRTGACGARSW
jgi:hypothetical protein